MKMENCKPATSQKPQNFLNDINEKTIKNSISKYLEHFWPNSFKSLFLLIHYYSMQ